MQKVVVINVNSIPKKDSDGKQIFSELQFPELQKHLDEGYHVYQFHQIAPSQNSACAILTFILEK